MRALALALALAPALASATAVEGGSDEVIIGVTRRECTRPAGDVTWDLKGDVEVGQVLHALAQLACERYIAPRDLLRTRVTLSVKNEKAPAREIRDRVVGALRAQGIAVEVEMAYRVHKGGEGTAGGLVGSSPPPPPPPAPRTAAVSDEELAKSIRCKATKCEITRKTLDAILADTPGLAASVRIVPSMAPDGTQNGMKLFGIRAHSYVGRLGFLNGDVLSAVAGVPIRSPETALEAYAKIRSATRITVEVVRQGQPVTLDYTIK